jgi:hypothetical protein
MCAYSQDKAKPIVGGTTTRLRQSMEIHVVTTLLLSTPYLVGVHRVAAACRLRGWRDMNMYQVPAIGSARSKRATPRSTSSSGTTRW